MQASGHAGTEQLAWKRCLVIIILLSFPTFPFLPCAAGMRGNDFLPVQDGTGGICVCVLHSWCLLTHSIVCTQLWAESPARGDVGVWPLGQMGLPWEQPKEQPQLPAHLHRGWLHALLPYVRVRRLHHAPKHHHG